MKRLLQTLFALLVLNIPSVHAQDNYCGTRFPDTVFVSDPSSLGKIVPDVDLATASLVDIPIAVHIVGNSITPSQLPGMVSNLNTAFAPAKMQFFVCSTDYIDGAIVPALHNLAEPADWPDPPNVIQFCILDITKG